MINLIIFLISFVCWLICMFNHKNKWYTYVFAFLWGAFIVQTIIWFLGCETLLETLFSTL